MKAKNPGALSGRTWTSILLFGLIGQIAWVVENMYFSRFMQNEITRAPYATTLMVAFSALFATLSTLLGGAICDRTGKRKVFITWGYVIWGFTIMAFALIPMQPAPDKVKAMVILVVVMDCVMSVIGSISNDASFNTWITDMTNTANRSKVDTILAVLPLLAIAVVFVDQCRCHYRRLEKVLYAPGYHSHCRRPDRRVLDERQAGSAKKDGR